jgi:hypothetical protein
MDQVLAGAVLCASVRFAQGIIKLEEHPREIPSTLACVVAMASNDNKTIKLPCDLTKREQEMMALIGAMLEAEEEGKNMKRPRFFADGDEFDATGTEDYGVEDFVVRVVIRGSICEFPAWRFDTIDCLKQKIQDKFGIPRDEQILLRGRGGREALAGDYTLAYHDIGANDLSVLKKATESHSASASASSSSSRPPIVAGVAAVDDKIKSLEEKVSRLDGTIEQLNNVVRELRQHLPPAEEEQLFGPADEAP